MRKLAIFIVPLFASLSTFAQVEPLSKADSLALELQKVTVANAQQQRAIQTLNEKVSKLGEQVQTLKSDLQSGLQANHTAIGQTEQSLNSKIAESDSKASEQIAGVSQALSAKAKWGIGGGVALLLLSVALFVWLWRRQKAGSKDIIGQLEKTKASVEERLVAEFAKQTEVMQSLVETLHATSLPTATATPDHSLALKLADEITLMERNLSLMDAQTKGLKQLNRSIGKLKDNLAANGYEIPTLLGKPYNEGMKAIITNTIQDEALEKGVEVISKIIKPQVNYKDVMVQAAQIEVSVG